MSYWKLIALLLTSCASAPTDVRSSTRLLDGMPNKGTLSANVKYAYNGKSSLVIITRRKKIFIDPKSPALISTSKDEKFLVLNYGDGSGQVYSVSLYDLSIGTNINLSPSLSHVISYARSHNNCTINLDQISFVFDRWIGSNEFLVKTEDFSRSPNCGHANQLWKVDLFKAKRNTQAFTMILSNE